MDDGDVIIDSMIHPDIERIIKGEDVGNGGFQRAVCIQLKIIFERQLKFYSLHEKCKAARIQELSGFRTETDKAIKELADGMKEFAFTNRILKVFASLGALSMFGAIGWFLKTVAEHIIKGAGG